MIERSEERFSENIDDQLLCPGWRQIPASCKNKSTHNGRDLRISAQILRQPLNPAALLEWMDRWKARGCGKRCAAGQPRRPTSSRHFAKWNGWHSAARKADDQLVTTTVILRTAVEFR